MGVKVEGIILLIVCADVVKNEIRGLRFGIQTVLSYFNTFVLCFNVNYD